MSSVLRALICNAGNADHVDSFADIAGNEGILRRGSLTIGCS
jgi:hypothetical protein